MQIIYLIFTEGHAATGGPDLVRADLAVEAIRLARQLHGQLSDRAEATGLLALLLLTDARRPARLGPGGDLVPLDRQDRRLWSRPMIVEGLRLLTAALSRHSMGPYQLQAAIAAVHDEAPSYEATDWARVRALYDLLAEQSDNVLVGLNRAVAIAHTDGPEAALSVLDGLGTSLADHHRYHATLGYLRDRSGDHDAARRAYGDAAGLATNEPERRYLQGMAASRGGVRPPRGTG